MSPNQESQNKAKSGARAIAFYLPQYHPIPENNEWWGKGFTEWTNVVKAKPLFKGHHQPHLPADLGFYDLRLEEAREAQANLAKEYHVHGFCYYHYWFNGRRILERPFDDVLKSGKPDLPFCLCWANENWTRAWDGLNKNILLGQHYSTEDDLAHIQHLIPAFRDERYIRVNGKALFLVYRTELLPDPKRTAQIWREAAEKAGVGELYLVRVERFQGDLDPASIGFDAAVEFAPDGAVMGQPLWHRKRHAPLTSLGLLPKAYIHSSIYDYQTIVQRMLKKPEPDYKLFLGVAPSWDNTARKAKNASLMKNSSPAGYEKWLKETVKKTLSRFKGDEQLLFINAWNEWGEGCHLEPDQKYGRQYLEATKRALSEI